MGTIKQGGWPVDTEPSWTDDTLPLDVRRKLLDRALDTIKAQKRVAHGHPGNQGQPDHPGESGSESADHND
ncbi:hypothetical protein ACFPOE_18885 [Caenimonas terrae]|uniref:Uncharacterized protein n=1 Tax=Caenimonas terrae TaxID=696074 RepID=A0ABW0NHU1_9BURK